MTVYFHGQVHGSVWECGGFKVSVCGGYLEITAVAYHTNFLIIEVIVTSPTLIRETSQVPAQYADYPQGRPRNRILGEGLLRHTDTNACVWLLNTLASLYISYTEVQ